MPYVLSLETVLAYLQVLTYLNLEYYTTSHRLWEVTSFKVDLPLFLPLLLLTLVTAGWVLARKPRALFLTFIGVLSFLILDVGVALAVVSLISVIVALYLRCRLRDYCTGLLGIMFVVEASSLLHWLIFVPMEIRDPLQVLTSLELSHYYLVAQLSPIYMLAFTVVGVGVPLYHLSRKPTSTEAVSPDRSALTNRVWLVLGLTLLLSAVVVVYPYLPSINPGQINPGVDIGPYLEEYQRVVGDPSSIFTASGGDRPIYYLLLFTFQRATSLDPLMAIQYLPVILNPLLCLSAFILTREFTQDSSAAIYAAFFTASGFTLSVGMYAYFLADMLMLSIIFLSLAALVKALRDGSRLYLGAAIVLGSFTVFTHPWTFDQYMAAVGGATILSYILISREESSYWLNWVIIYCLAVAGADVLKLLLFRGSVEGIAALSLLLGNLTTIATFWLDLLNSSRFYVGGYLTNMPLLTLAALGIIRANKRTISNLILWVLLALTSALYLIGGIVVKSRLLYNIPVGLLAALGVSYIDDLGIDGRLKTVLKAVIVVSLLSYLFRDLANLV
jgi:hypothetical protein